MYAQLGRGLAIHVPAQKKLPVGRRPRHDLRKNAEYDIDTGLYTIHLRVENGGIAFVDSPCPDHLCEGFGTLKNEGDWAACMPAKASVTIE